MDYFQWRPYVPVAERRRRAAKEMAKLKTKGHRVSPVVIEGRTIARTFWGKAWCDNLERYSDYSNRLPRGRSYVRNGSVVDLQVTSGEVKAHVSGSEIYKVAVKVSPVPKARWNSVCRDCAGGIDSLVELLQGRFSRGVMERICMQRTGLFPSPEEIELSCSCPDWATMCKHVAAVLYGIGARLDEEPGLLFKLRDVDEKDLIARAGTGLPLSRKGPAAERVLDSSDLSAIFGLELAKSAKRETGEPGKKARRRGANAPAEKKKEAARATAAGSASHGKSQSSRRKAAAGIKKSATKRRPRR